jgi:hypothetical protein
MYFLTTSSAQAARSTQLDNLQRFSQIVIDAAEKFIQLGNSLSEAILDDGSQSSAMGFNPLSSFENSSHLWLELSKHHLPSFITNYIHIASQAHEEMVKLAEEQIRLSQQLVVISLDKAKASAPWEAESLLKAIKSSVNFSSDALAQVSEASIKAAELVEEQVEKAIKPARRTVKAAA